MTQKEYEHYRAWKKEEMEKAVQDVTYRMGTEQYAPLWYPDPRAENLTDGETNEEDNDKIDYRVSDPWAEKKGKAGGMFIHPDIAQPLVVDDDGNLDQHTSMTMRSR